ncbi:2-phosphosulfolactate phosphatase [Microbacterium invictum]|uniref:Probable 2-phosphosulfolactate phosphatase n=1 Tax=Microbacterium invictum TaxID=515415 RepID=A0AA40SPX4_9MICO|nr:MULTISPECIES: 2-phosphosulfolactate phosphatase [Microbacterium]MBB4140171.1 2-phosphosulfolactate phosphatase [Microbacterium invictum]
MTTPFDQARYQIRFEWGSAGLDRLDPADVTVVVDVLRFSSTVATRLAAGDTVALDESAHAVSLNGAAVAAHAAQSGTVVLLGGLTNATAVAAGILDEQRRRGARTSINVIAAGELTSREPSAPLRFAVEDLFGAGAVIDALAAIGLDYSSPEAAAACESFRSLRGAVRHLLTASGSGQELLDRDQRDEVLAAGAVDSVASVPVLRDGLFTAL